MEECGPCPVFASFTLAFALQLRKKHGKTSVRLKKPQSQYSVHIIKNTHTLQNLHKHTHYKNPLTHTYTHTHTHARARIHASNKIQRYTVYLYLETALHVSGGTSTHHQERIQLYLQHLVFVTTLLLSAAIVEELEPV